MGVEKMFALIGSLLLGAAYIIGYSYLDGYYEYYDLPLAELDFGIQYIIAHSFPSFGYDSLLVGIFVSIPIFAPFMFERVRSFFFDFSLPLFVSLVVISVILTMRAHDNGNRNANRDFAHLSRVILSEGSMPAVMSDISAAVERPTFHFLVSTGGKHFFVIKSRHSKRRWVIHVESDENFHFGVFLNP